jgi:Na+-transporting methylmalonyl-CoA/oxaloacetate decarboxylase gamma subunit
MNNISNTLASPCLIGITRFAGREVMNSTRFASSDYVSDADIGNLFIIFVLLVAVVGMICNMLKQAKQEEDEEEEVEEEEQTPLSEPRAIEAEILHETLVPIYIQQSG